MFLFLVWTIVYQRTLIIKKDILDLGEGSTDGIDNAAITTEAKYSVNNTKSKKKICLSLHCTESNSFL